MKPAVQEGIKTCLERTTKSLPGHFDITHGSQVSAAKGGLVVHRGAEGPSAEDVPLIDFCGALQAD